MPTPPTLEAELERRAKKCEHAAKMLRSYQVMKDYLEDNYYDWVQANLPYFTDHGRHHISSVIHSASQIIGPATLKREDGFSSLDIFVLLTAIIWHDAGMVLTRSGHQNEVKGLMEEVRRTALPNPTVFRVVNDVVKAHTGNTSLDIPEAEFSCAYAPNATYTGFPRSLAAVLRLADEISENRTRVSTSLVNKVPEGSQIGLLLKT